MKYTELDDNEEFYRKVEYYNKARTEKLSYHYKEILKLLGEDPEREGLVKTPYRVAKAMQFMTRGYTENPEEILLSPHPETAPHPGVHISRFPVYRLLHNHPQATERCISFFQDAYTNLQGSAHVHVCHRISLHQC